MYGQLIPRVSQPGFNFDNCERNNHLIGRGFAQPDPVKTGTTIAGIIYRDGVILGSDTRATDKNFVSDKNSDKIHYLAKNMYCCGAGTAADTEMTTQTIAAQVELLRLHKDGEVQVATGAKLLQRMLYRYQGNIGAALVLGGCDFEGPHIYCIYPHGSVDKLSFASLGSGSLAAISVFEARYDQDLSEEAGKTLVRDAIAAGIFNDLGSGSNIDLCVIRKDGSRDILRSYEEPNIKGTKHGKYTYCKGTTPIIKSKIISFDIVKESAKELPTYSGIV